MWSCSNRWARIVGFAAVVAGCGGGGMVVPCKAQIPDLRGGSMLSCSGLPCMEVTVDSGTRLKLLIDTGNTHSLLDEAKAKALGLELQPINGPDGKPYPGYWFATLKAVKAGDASLGELKVLVADLRPSLAKGDFPTADGTLAYTAFQDRVLKLDYRNQWVGISEPLKADVPCPDSCGELTTPTFGRKGPAIVATTGFRVNNEPVVVQIDTLYSGTILIYPTSVGKLGLANQAASARKRFFPFTDGGVDMLEGAANAETFGTMVLKKDASLYFATPKVHTPDGMFDGTVGHELFAGHVLMLDFHAHHFWLT